MIAVIGNPWLESIGVALLAGAGVWLGRWFSRLPRFYWVLGYILPLVLVVVYGLAMRKPILGTIAPISWMMMGRSKFAVIGFIATLILTTPLSRIPQRRNRIAITILMVVVVGQMSVWPFLAPAFNRAELARLKTRFDADQICRQSNDYNCGPAAAVTALRRLGLPVEEGELAILAHTTASTGTPPDILAQVLQERYGRDGLKSKYRVFTSLDELKHDGYTLAVIKYQFWVDHYVTVFDVTDTQVIVGDPAFGLNKMSRAEFEQKWRFVGVVLKRASN